MIRPVAGLMEIKGMAVNNQDARTPGVRIQRKDPVPWRPGCSDKIPGRRFSQLPPLAIQPGFGRRGRGARRGAGQTFSRSL